MASKRFKQLPNKTKDLESELIEKLLAAVKKKLHHKIWWINWFKLSS